MTEAPIPHQQNPEGQLPKDSPLEARARALLANLSPQGWDAGELAIATHLFEETWTNLTTLFEGKGAIKNGTIFLYKYVPNPEKSLTLYQDEYRRNTVGASANITEETTKELSFSTDENGKPTRIHLGTGTHPRSADHYTNAVKRVADKHLPPKLKALITPHEFALEFLAGVSEARGQLPPKDLS